MNSLILSIFLCFAGGVFSNDAGLLAPNVKRHTDGSVSSHSGPSVPFLELIRSKRTPYRQDVEYSFNYGLSQSDIDGIVEEHNNCRRKVYAGNMRKMYWDSGLAAQAQAYANTCNFAHSTTRRNTGENIWATASMRNDIARYAVRWWYDELGTCGCGNTYTHCCGHYSQIIWANTNRVGCGFASCPSIANAPGMNYIFVCQYTPAGNCMTYSGGQLVSLSAYNSGSACSSCPSGSSCDNGLCT